VYKARAGKSVQNVARVRARLMRRSGGGGPVLVGLTCSGDGWAPAPGPRSNSLALTAPPLKARVSFIGFGRAHLPPSNYGPRVIREPYACLRKRGVNGRQVITT
jgi:hypothetical protein